MDGATASLKLPSKNSSLVNAGGSNIPRHNAEPWQYYGSAMSLMTLTGETLYPAYARGNSHE